MLNKNNLSALETHDQRLVMLWNIVNLLQKHKAIDLSDNEISRCMDGCCGAGALILYATEFRENGTIRAST